MTHFSYSLKPSEVTSRACLFTPHLPGTLSSSLRLPPSPRRSLEKEGQRRAQWGASFTGLLLPPAAGSAPRASRRNWLLSVCAMLAPAGRGLETFPASLPFGVCPHPPRCPSHSQIYTRLEPGQFHALGIKTQRRLITPPWGHAAVCEQEPKKRVRNL